MDRFEYHSQLQYLLLVESHVAIAIAIVIVVVVVVIVIVVGTT